MRKFIIPSGGSARGNYPNGRRGHPLYETWRGMIARCDNPNRGDFRHYGGRGIGVCADWRDMFVFVDWAEANGWERGLTLDRIDNDGNYEPTNCRWVTLREQTHNRRTSRHIEINGERMCVAEAARRFGLSEQTLGARLKRGLPPEEAVKPPR